ncbi:MAG TPA: DUF5684 domain-containing protein [Gemmatimonadales bacterium]
MDESAINLVAFHAFMWVFYWPLFERANHPGWMALVPIYNAIVLCRIAGRSAWWALPISLPYVGLLLRIPVGVSVAGAFRRGRTFGVGLAVLPYVFVPVLVLSRPD